MSHHSTQAGGRWSHQSISAIICLIWASGLCLTVDLHAQETGSDAGKPTKTATAAQDYGWDPEGVADFSLTDRTGETITKQTLLGKEWVCGFIFTRCKGPCPALVGQMKLLQEQTGVTLVTISVQPEVDTPDVLRNFATAYVPNVTPDSSSNTPTWYWLTGDRGKIYQLINKSFRLPAAEVPGPEGFNVVHSNNLVHLDEQGHILGIYNALQPTEMVLLRRILQGKAERGRMIRSNAPAGTEIEMEGGREAGLKFLRTETAEEPVAGEELFRDADGELTTGTEAPFPNWVTSLPAINASLNGIATILLITGYVFVRRKRITEHKVCMLASFATSIVFLGCYLVYHYYVGSRKFPGTGALRVTYLLILATHVVLAAAVPFLASVTIYRALKQQWSQHRAIARITFPIWVYVSITGVVIYFMLYHLPVATTVANQ